MWSTVLSGMVSLPGRPQIPHTVERARTRARSRFQAMDP